MLFNGQTSKAGKVAPVPTEMRVRISQTWHQCPPSTFEMAHIGIFQQLGLV
jgi:hypothetical protein